jgi:aldehyde dehydrogenase (NAD+)
MGFHYGDRNGPIAHSRHLVRTTPTSLTVERLATQGHLIGDVWRSSDEAGTHRHSNPATGQVQAEIGLAGAGDVDDAVRAAQGAQEGWAATSPAARAAVLFRLADLLDAHAAEAAELAALDNGTPISVMNPGGYAASWVRYYAGWCDKLTGDVIPSSRGHHSDRPEPYGVVAAIPPWNGSMMGMGQKCGPALAAGNVVVAKPPELAPFGMLRFAELALEAGLPRGVLNVVVGGPTAGAALVGHPGIDKISFTGGTATGRTLMEIAARNLTPLTLELGGKSPNIIFPDADLDAAATMAAFAGPALLSGQGCALPTRLYVHADVYDQVVAKVVETVTVLQVGDPLDPATLVGPVVSEAAMHRILGVIERAKADGASLLIGGSRLGGELGAGWFVAPTVFGDVDHDSDLARNEVFGPVLAVLRFHTEEEVLNKANNSEFGLSAYLHTRDRDRIDRLVRRLVAGTIVVNGMGRSTPAAPFGGTKRSGFGREGGRAGIEEMVRHKTVFES